MNKLSIHKLKVVLFLLLIVSVSCNTQLFHNMSGRKTEKKMAGQSRTARPVREPRAVTRAKKEQADRQSKNKKEYYKSVDRSKKRTLEIQTPEVRARMEQNQKNISARDKMKTKRTRSATRKAGKKYR